jgi:hypothetical protein
VYLLHLWCQVDPDQQVVLANCLPPLQWGDCLGVVEHRASVLFFEFTLDTAFARTNVVVLPNLHIFVLDRPSELKNIENCLLAEQVDPQRMSSLHNPE